MTPHTFSESLSQSFAIILYFSPSISLQKEITVILKGKKTSCELLDFSGLLSVVIFNLSIVVFTKSSHLIKWHVRKE